MSERLKLSEDKVENLKMLRLFQEEKANAYLGILETLEARATHAEEKLTEMEEQLRDEKETVMKTESAFKAIADKLKVTEENLIATEAKLNKCEKSLTMTEKKNGELRFGLHVHVCCVSFPLNPLTLFKYYKFRVEMLYRGIL